MLQGLGVGARNRATRPERLFIQLDSLLFHAAKNHRSQPAISHRQRFDPPGGRLAVPEFKGAFGFSGIGLTGEKSYDC